jgi:hypothetical protein
MERDRTVAPFAAAFRYEFLDARLAARFGVPASAAPPLPWLLSNFP